MSVSTWQVSLVAAVVVVAVVAVPLWLIGAGRGDEVTPGLPEGTIALEASHPAMRLLAEGATDYDTFSAAASEQELHFTCASGGGTPPGSSAWWQTTVSLPWCRSPVLRV